MTDTNYDFESDTPCAYGIAWCGESGQEQWTFIMVLPRGTGSYDDIDWMALLPHRDEADWLRIDRPGKRLEVMTAAVKLSYDDSNASG